MPWIWPVGAAERGAMEASSSPRWVRARLCWGCGECRASTGAKLRFCACGSWRFFFPELSAPGIGRRQPSGQPHPQLAVGRQPGRSGHRWRARLSRGSALRCRWSCRRGGLLSGDGSGRPSGSPPSGLAACVGSAGERQKDKSNLRVRRCPLSLPSRWLRACSAAGSRGSCSDRSRYLPSAALPSNKPVPQGGFNQADKLSSLN